MKKERQHDRQHRMGVLERVEGQVARCLDTVVAGAVGRVGVAELVQAQRHDPAGQHEHEHAEVCGSGPGSVVAPAEPPGENSHGDEGQKDGARPYRAAAAAFAQVIDGHRVDGTGRHRWRVCVIGDGCARNVSNDRSMR